MIMHTHPELCELVVVKGRHRVGTPGRFHLARIEQVIGQTFDDPVGRVRVFDDSLDGSFATARAAMAYADLEWPERHTFCRREIIET